MRPPLTVGRRCLHGHMPFTKEMPNLEKLIFSCCIGGCEALSSMGILTYAFCEEKIFDELYKIRYNNDVLF